MFKRSFKQGDLLLIAGVLTAALILIGIRWMNGHPEGADQISEGYYATIKVDNEIFRTVQLTREPQYIEVRTERGYDLLKVHDYGIEVVESDCPQKICFTFGHITKPGEVIICLPLRMIIEVSGHAPETGIETEIDAEVY